MKTVKWIDGNIKEIGENLLEGKVIVLPSDTLYGIMTCANNKKSVERIYEIKGRNPSKPVIILIGKIEELEKFGVKANSWQLEQLNKYWPGKVSAILPCFEEKFEYLHRGTNTLAFRIPNNPLLKRLLEIAGPLVAPSANTEGKDPALKIEEAKAYFGENVDLYADGGTRNSPPSTLISLISNNIEVLRGELKS